MGWCLDICIAITAIASAVFWFFSAYGKLPAMVSYWDGTPEDDAFYRAIKFSAKMNRVAAALTGLSAIITAVKALFA